MPDWSKTMQQTFEFYRVDPATWMDDALLEEVKSCSISWDSSAETLGSATIESTEVLSEQYVRIYLVTIQNGIRERFALGTFLVQTPSVGFDGRVSSISMDAYTPLLELKDTMPPRGYAVLKDTPIMETIAYLCAENARAPVIFRKNKDTLIYLFASDGQSISGPSGSSIFTDIVFDDSETTLQTDFVSSLDDSWLSFISDLIANAKHRISLDEEGHILFTPIQETAALQPVWTFDDSNSSILYPEVSINRDLYGIPNVVEVIYSSGTTVFYSRVVNNNTDSPISTVNRGREIVHRVTDPDIGGNPTQGQLDVYARELLENFSTLEYKVTYKHGYCDRVRVGDAVLLNYERAGLNNVKAKVVSQTIRCETGCPVEETAVFTTNLWGGNA